MHLTAEQKHLILLEYRPRSPNHCFGELARRHSVKGGRCIVHRWHEKWDGTAQSVQPTDGAGRPRVLTEAQVALHVAPRIRAANRRRQAVHYPDIMGAVQHATGTTLSLRMLQTLPSRAAWGAPTDDEKTNIQ